MHDFMLAKEIVDTVLAIAKEKQLDNLKVVSLEIGTGSLPHDHHHDGQDEHLEELDLENVKFGIAGIIKNTSLKDTKFKIEKISGSEWKITNIEV